MRNMKKTKALAALLATLSVLSSVVALQACSDKENESSLSSSSIETSLDSSSGSVTDSSSANSSSSLSSASSSSSSSATKPDSSSSSSSSAPVKTYAQYIRCTGDRVNIRSGAGTEYAVLGSAEKNTTYAVVGKTGSWYKTYYRNKIAYIYASYASVLTLEKSNNDDVESVIEEGYKLLGVPYVYGAMRLHDGKGKLLSGFTAQKFDCSSLIQYVFYKGAGTLLNTTTRTQVKQGKYVAKKDLQRGDCIFFTNEDRQYNTGIERIGHVALYLGNDYILHTSSDYARIEKMTASRWKFYVEARRFI